MCGNIFKLLSLPNRKSWGAAILRERSPPPPVMCHMSHVTCHMSHVTGPMSQYINIYMYIFLLLFGQGGEKSRWIFCYQWGYPD